MVRSAAGCFYAHSTESADTDNWQRLDDHLKQVAQLAAARAVCFNAETAAYITGLFHDLGKYTEAFQRRLHGESIKAEHSGWGAHAARERYPGFGQLLAYAIAGHHAGLANGRNGQTRTALHERLQNPGPPLSRVWEQELAPPTGNLKAPDGFQPRKDRIGFQHSVLTRMLFSCLVDADYTDTEAFYDPVSVSSRRQSPPSLRNLCNRLNTRLAKFTTDGDVNRRRAEILRHVRSLAPESPGVFSLTVPTGGGKTLASLAFALDHAIRHHLRRVIYVIPFTSIVEQTATVFRDAFDDLGNAAVLEHHSAFSDDELQIRNPESRDKLRFAMENWEASIIVTTAVQFFESLFADRPSRCRKLHNISGSVVVLDEAQTLPLHLLRPCVAMLDELARNYRTSIVLCTATQPALAKNQGFRDGFDNVRELAPEPQILYAKMRRVTVRHAGHLNNDQIVERMLAQPQALCIVNNRRHARALYEKLTTANAAVHLSTLMYARHRSEVLKQVRLRLQKGERCRLIATSLIEAGVDIDFPAVLRAEAGLDSIAQASGRCNREGKRSASESIVTVFSVDESEYAPPPELKQFAQVFREIHRAHAEDPLSLEAVHAYFEKLYWQKGERELDKCDILGLLHESRPDSLPFETIAAKFRLIEVILKPVIIALEDKAQGVVEELKYAGSPGGPARRLQPFIVGVPIQGYEALLKADAIVPIAPDQYQHQFMLLSNPDLYSPEFGLHWDDPSFIQSESLCW